jgi:hypothetical protein
LSINVLHATQGLLVRCFALLQHFTQRGVPSHALETERFVKTDQGVDELGVRTDIYPAALSDSRFVMFDTQLKPHGPPDKAALRMRQAIGTAKISLYGFDPAPDLAAKETAAVDPFYKVAFEPYGQHPRKG